MHIRFDSFHYGHIPIIYDPCGHGDILQYPRICKSGSSILGELTQCCRMGAFGYPRASPTVKRISKALAIHQE